MRHMRYVLFVVSYLFLSILSISPHCTLYVLLGLFFFLLSSMKSDADWVLDACSSLFLTLPYFPPLFSLSLSRVGAHCRLSKPNSGHHQGLCYFTYCLFAHDMALLMEYITSRYITLQLPSGRILAIDGSGLVSGLFGSFTSLSQQVLGGSLRYWHMYLATYAFVLIIMFLAVQLIYPSRAPNVGGGRVIMCLNTKVI